MASRKPAAAGQLLGALLISVLLLALTGLFGVWYSHEKAFEALRQVRELSRLIDSARQAQVEFKTQVQLWKNLLLRGQVPKDLAEYRERFEGRQALVQKNLADILAAGSLPGDMRGRVEAMVQDHLALAKKYETALVSYHPGDAASIFRVDAEVRGIDQELNLQIDQFADAMIALESRRVEELQAETDALYRGLQLAVLVVSAIAIVCASALAWRSLVPKG